jgi:diguanylate cyclase (GGDEF)-like protein
VPDLEAVVRVAGVVARARTPEEVLEAAAAGIAEALGEVSVSVSRFEAEHLRILITVGEPAHLLQETYLVSEHPHVESAWRGASYFLQAEDPALTEPERARMQSSGKATCVGVPILSERGVWGVLEAFSVVGAPPLDPSAVHFLEAVAAQISASLERAELFERIAELAYRDGLTGLPNRRAFDEHAETAAARVRGTGIPLAVVFCDLDGLKEINDVEGHEAGDRALRAAAEALTAAAQEASNAFVARLGGDEFCVLLVGADTETARRLALDAGRRLSAGPMPALTLSCGVAAGEVIDGTLATLLRSADAAQYAAKRLGRSRVYVAEGGEPLPGGAPRARRRRVRDGEPDVHVLLRSTIARLDETAAAGPPAERLRGVAMAFAEAFDLGGWAVSRAQPGAEFLATVSQGGRRTHPAAEAASLHFSSEGEDLFALADYPVTARTLAESGWFHVARDDPQADSAERALLCAYGHHAVLGVAARGRDGADWLLELYADERTWPLEGAVPELRLLVLAAVAAGT